VSSGMLLLGFIFICISLVANWYPHSLYYPITFFGAEVWVPILGIIGASFGVRALWSGYCDKPRLLLSHFVMCVMNAISSMTLFVSSSMFASKVSNYLYDHSSPDNDSGIGLIQYMMVFQIMLAVAAVISLSANIASSVFLFRFLTDKNRLFGLTATTVECISAPSYQHYTTQPVFATVGSQSLYNYTPSNPISSSTDQPKEPEKLCDTTEE